MKITSSQANDQTQMCHGPKRFYTLLFSWLNSIVWCHLFIHSFIHSFIQLLFSKYLLGARYYDTARSKIQGETLSLASDIGVLMCLLIWISESVIWKLWTIVIFTGISPFWLTPYCTNDQYYIKWYFLVSWLLYVKFCFPVRSWSINNGGI